MIRKILSFTVLVLTLTFSSFAETFSSEGYGQSLEEARAQALRELSLTFSNRIQSSSQARQSYASSGGKTASMREMDIRILVTSDMQLYGVSFETADNGKKGKEKKYTVRATMETSKSAPFYETEIKSLVKKIDARVAALPSLSANKEDEEWQSLSADYASFDKLEMVLVALSGENKIKPKLSSSDFRIKYERRAKENNTLEKAAENIAKAILSSSSKNRIYVYAPLFEGENTTTDFSVALANAVKSKLGNKISLTKIDSDSSLSGSYYFAPGSVNGEDIIVNYYLQESSGTVLASSGMIKIPYKVYSQYKYVPRNYDLHKEIAAGRTANPAFDISIRVNGERNALNFKRGDSLVIEVRATSACYIYVVGYVYNDEGDPLSYLFPLEPYAEGKEMFVKKISPKEANTWVVINPVVDNEVMNIEVIPPFGEETLQVFASTTTDFDEFAAKIPSYTETDDFFLVSGKPVETVSKTRALNVKRVANKAKNIVNTAENSVSYSTRK